MQDKDLSQKIFSGMKWKAFERFFLQFINAVTPMVLARLLMPEDFGTIAILTVFTSLANTFVNNGLCNSIIQKKDSDNIDCSTVFYTQIIVAVVCYVILFFAAPFIARTYHNKELTLMLRIMSLTVVIGSFGAMQTTMMKKKMQFNKSFLVYGSSTIAYGVVGIGMAYLGFGSWSLVYANLANSLFLVLSSILVLKWKPIWRFSFERLKRLFSYSWKLTVGWFVGTLHQDLYTLVIGKRFNKITLGYYNRAGSFPQIISKTVTEVVDGVMFPALSQIQDDRIELKNVTRKLISLNAYILFPLFFGLAAVGDNLVTILLTEKWLPSVSLMQIMCVTYCLNSLNNSNMQVFNSMGRSDIFMKFELVKRSISIILMIVLSTISIYAVVLVLLLMAVVSNAMNAYQNKKLLEYKYSEFLYDVIPPFFLALFMAICVWFVGRIKLNLIILLILQVLCGVGCYLAFSVIFKLNSFIEIFKLLKNRKLKD